jgi:DNA-directed RNA polymerase
MRWLQACAKGITTDIAWTTRLGFPAMQEYRVQKRGDISTVLQGNTVRPSSLLDTPTVDTRKGRQGLSPNLVHSLDSTHLCMTVNALRAEGVRSVTVIHDSFGVHAAHRATLDRVLREEFVRLYSGDVLGGIYRQLAAQWDDPTECPEPPKRGDLDLTAVLASPYMFS